MLKGGGNFPTVNTYYIKGLRDENIMTLEYCFFNSSTLYVCTVAHTVVF
jgi:hypothetical protein